MYTPKVSVITVVFNGEKFLEETILSVLGQTYQHIEYIIIDGGSTDSTPSIIRKYEDRLDSWISERDRGISDAFNKGIARATGEIIGLLNSDDWYMPDAVERVVRKIENADIVFGDMQLWKDGRKEFIMKGNVKIIEKEMRINHPTVFVRKSCYERYGVFDLNWKCAMDYDLLLRMNLNHCRFGYVPEVLANMRWGGMSDNQWKIGCKETLLIKNKYMPERKFSNRVYYIKHLIAIRTGRLYRQFFSRLKINED